MTVSTLQLVGILIGAALGLFVFLILWTQHQTKKAVVGHLWATFYTPTGARYEALCASDGNQVEAPAKAVGALKGKDKTYFVREDKTFDTLYPPGRPSWLQVTVPSTAYYEGNPEPIVSRDPKNRMEPIGTATVVHNIRDEKMTGLMVRVGEEMERFRRAAQGMVSPKLIYLLLVVTIIIGTINILLVFNAFSQVSKLARLWGL